MIYSKEKYFNHLPDSYLDLCQDLRPGFFLPITRSYRRRLVMEEEQILQRSRLGFTNRGSRAVLVIAVVVAATTTTAI